MQETIKHIQEALTVPSIPLIDILQTIITKGYTLTRIEQSDSQANTTTSYHTIDITFTHPNTNTQYSYRLLIDKTNKGSVFAIEELT